MQDNSQNAPDNSQLPGNSQIYQQDITPGVVTQPSLVAGGNQKGDIYYGLDGIRFARLGVGSSYQVLGIVNGIPAWGITQQVVALATTTTPSIDLSAGNIFTKTLGANTTYSIANVIVPKVFMVEVKQGSGTSYTNTWFSGVTWITSGGTAPIQTTTSGGYTTYGFRVVTATTFFGYLVGTN